VFPENGPWVEALAHKGITCLQRQFTSLDKSHLIRSIRSFIYWYSVIKRHNVDIIHVNEHDNYPVIKHVAGLMNIPTVVGVRFVLDGGYGKWAFGSSHRPSNLLFTSQDQLDKSKHDLPTDFPASRISVIGNGRNLEPLRSQVQDFKANSAKKDGKSIVIGTASVIRPRKRIEDFIETIEELLNSGCNVKGVIAGGGKFADEKYFAYLQSLVKEKALNSSITFLGNVENVSEFYGSIDIFLSTSELETFGMSVLEAMACGLPVVTYEGGSVKEVLDDPQYTTQTGDKKDLFLKTKILVQNEKERELLGAKNRQRAFSTFDGQIIADRIMKVYEENMKQ